MAQVRFIDDGGNLQTKTLDSEQCLIGRAPNCQVILVDDTISREHARLDLEGGGRYRVRDLGSRNKTFVNGELITDTLLTGGDIVRVGARVLEFLDDTISSENPGLDFLTPDRAEPPHSDWVKCKAPLSLTMAQVERLSYLTAERRLTTRSEDLATAALGQLLLDLQAERGWIAFRGDAKTELVTLAHRGLKRPTGGSLTPVSQSFVSAPSLQHVGGRYPQTAAQLSAKLGYASAAMVAPLMAKGEQLGIVYIDRPAARKPFTPAELHFLMAAGAHLGAALEDVSARLVRDAARESAAWVATLRRVQRVLAPTPSSSATFNVASKLFPGRARCGDFADVIHLDEQRCCALLVDAGGHGLPGLAQSAAIRGAVRAALQVAEDVLLDPSAVFAGINAMIASSPSRKCFPCLYLGIDLAAGKLAYINAGGMPPLLMIGPGRLMTLDQTALILGVDGEQSFEATRIDLPEAFRLIAHTDGLIEAVNGASEPVGAQRLHEALLAPEAFATVHDVVMRLDAVWTSHLAGAQPDDDALVLVIGRG